MLNNKYYRWFLLSLLLLAGFQGNVFGQIRYDTNCVEQISKGRYHCRLSPTSFTDWTYGTGYSDTSQSSFSTVEEAVARAIGYFTRNAVNLCLAQPEIGPEEIITDDRFVQSRQATRTRRLLTVKISVLDNQGKCPAPTDYSAWI